MPKRKSATSLKTIFILAFVAAAFVTAISWATFDDISKVAIAGGITFVVVFVGFAVLNWAAKDDDVKPGEPRLK